MKDLKHRLGGKTHALGWVRVDAVGEGMVHQSPLPPDQVLASQRVLATRGGTRSACTHRKSIRRVDLLGRRRSDGTEQPVHSNLGLHEKRIRVGKEASQNPERLNDAVVQAWALARLCWVQVVLRRSARQRRRDSHSSHAIDLFLERDERIYLYTCRRLLGRIYHPKNGTEKASRDFEIALGLASSFNGLNALFWIHL